MAILKFLNRLRSVFLLSLICNTFIANSQTNQEESLHNWFDNIVGRKNLDINNGPFYTDTYKTIGTNNMYLTTNKYTIGNINYEGQNYYNVNIKYNIYKDELILNPYGESEHIGITLIQDKIDSFYLNNKNFVKINQNESSLAQLTTGYYQLERINDNFNFYIKHQKKLAKRINDDGVYYNFPEDNQFFISFENVFYNTDSKNDIIKIFPHQKKGINDFYSTHRNLKIADYSQFIINLMKYINISQTNTTK
ncbi:hypothetical protein [Flavobacterium sp. Arc2]|uniref:hypothetical protein n=1 Tax=Flavobacterium sp. Arc2 TaxID=3046685 RepID=UPI00352CAEA5